MVPPQVDCDEFAEPRPSSLTGGLRLPRARRERARHVERVDEIATLVQLADVLAGEGLSWQDGVTHPVGAAAARRPSEGANASVSESEVRNSASRWT